MTQPHDAPATRRKPDWVLAVLAGTAVASVIATVVVFQTYAPPGPDAAQVAAWRQHSLAAVASVIATVVVFQTYAPPGPDAAQVAAWRQHSLAACRADRDLLVHLGIAAPAYDYLALQTPQFRFTIQRDGRAVLHVVAPEAERGDFTLRIAPADFARLASLTAALQLEHRGSRKPLLPDGGEIALEAGQGGQVAFVANETSLAGEFEALEGCLRSLSSNQRWVRDTSSDAIIVD